jgi:hypothetical protein
LGLAQLTLFSANIIMLSSLKGKVCEVFSAGVKTDKLLFFGLRQQFFEY